MSDTQGLLDLYLMLAVVALALVLLWVMYRHKGELRPYKDALRSAILSCPKCNGGGTRSIPGATFRCNYCGPMKDALYGKPRVAA